MSNRYVEDDNRNRTTYHKKTKTWFAYANCHRESVRGKGKTEIEAIANSIKNTKEQQK